MIVALTDFNTRPYLIPFQEEAKDLLAWMAAKEEDILRGLLGSDLYIDFIAAIAGTPAQKWVDLRDGTTYTYGGVTYQYKGLVDLLVPCIFAYWVKENSDKFTNVGTVRNSPAASSTAVSPARRISEAYGRFLDKVGDPSSYRDTLYGYLQANYSTYYSSLLFWDFNVPGSMNQFDL